MLSVLKYGIHGFAFYFFFLFSNTQKDLHVIVTKVVLFPSLPAEVTNLSHSRSIHTEMHFCGWRKRT
ncbi:hypothetical protein Zm00014a_003364 [Zea mays]|uniref:Uncharacterized protein n=1 Tax=Zea mays TaxID=4577 RepID=A0A3L6FL39_MAIZE|nr:hypothetical protein Zm00014a_003364 [Zea mays]